MKRWNLCCISRDIRAGKLRVCVASIKCGNKQIASSGCGCEGVTIHPPRKLRGGLICQWGREGRNGDGLDSTGFSLCIDTVSGYNNYLKTMCQELFWFVCISSSAKECNILTRSLTSYLVYLFVKITKSLGLCTIKTTRSSLTFSIIGTVIEFMHDIRNYDIALMGSSCKKT